MPKLDPSARRLRPTDSVRELRGVGPVLLERLRAVGIATVRDLLLCFPRRVRELEELDEPTAGATGRWVRVCTRIEGARLRWLPRRRSMVEVRLLTDGGEPLTVAFFNQPYLAKSLPVGERRIVEGLLERRGRRWSLQQARILAPDAVPEGPCQLRYAEIDGVSPARFKALVLQALRRTELSDWPEDPVPDSLRSQVALADPAAALRAMHMPADAAEHDAARRRFALIEAVQLFRRVERARRARLSRRGPRIAIDDRLAARLDAVFPFRWTTDQAAAIAALRAGLTGRPPLGVLLQGDVGTGKTAVALWASLAAIASGHQVAFLAPTELLAEQHHEGIANALAGTEVQVELLTSSLPAAERRAVDAAVRDGRAKLVVGTHALFSEATAFRSLGLVVIDEQHRFGVDQRMRLVRKGDDPHVLVMTATPIPRTLTLTLFGDLDALLLRERPRGRVPTALWLPPEQWPRIVATIARHVARGERAYVVCPKIGADGDKGGAVRLHRELSQHFACGLVHGAQPAAERRAATAAFRDGATPVLVGTTVLEVGVDVAMATLMVVIGADQLGLATLHQLRGRVGRSDRRGVCVLTGKRSERTDAVCATADGFELAEHDLRLRGSGELLGRRQSGLSDLRALDAAADLVILSRAREAVRAEAIES